MHCSRSVFNSFSLVVRSTMSAVCSRNEIIQFKNCRLIRNHQIIVDDLWIQNGKIINPEPVFFDQKIFSHRQIDCNDALIAPGFIDIQINGSSFRFLFFQLLLRYREFCFVRPSLTGAVISISLLNIFYSQLNRWIWY